MKTCSSCHIDKPLGDFAPAPRNRDGRRGQCRSCVRAYRREWRAKNAAKANGYMLKTRYGIDAAERDELLASQGGGCAICGGVATDVDHDHDSGLVRGVLCGSCNRMLGQANDDPDRLLAGALYLIANSKPVRS